ncbi:MAG: GNAT family N-acetyltransferase [Prevotella sp.]|nr:GNAT family N-acetyltransferase [Prevotella sp.]
MACKSFFHSVELFHIIEATPRHSPLMAVVFNDDEEVVAHMLATIRRRTSWLPPYLFAQARVYGEGEFVDGIDKDEVFSMMLQALTQRFHRRLCLYAEFSNMKKKMFGYASFRECGYFPVSWQEVHNSLHSMSPQERLSESQLEEIEYLRKRGVGMRRVQSEEELQEAYRLLRNFNLMKLHHFLPPEKLFSLLNEHEDSQILVTTFKEKLIGVSVTVYSEGNAYLWYVASKRKSYPYQHPDLMTVWYTLEEAYARQCRHLFFMDAGLPFQKSSYRDFILSFGGMPVAKYRWFHFSLSCINKFLSWLYRE